MTIHNPLTPPQPASLAGAAPVADLRALDAARALAVLMFRDWFDGPCGQERVCGMFCDVLGDDTGPVAFEAWSDCLDSLARHGRRALVHHVADCNCVGADEALVAQLFDSAASCAREDALMILALIMPADRGWLVLPSAERAGLAILRVAHRMCATPVHGTSRALH